MVYTGEGNTVSQPLYTARSLFKGNSVSYFLPLSLSLSSALDVSADLALLGRTPVAVVCAGVKSILDIGRTLEYLETQGVPVLTVGRDKTFPAFFTRDSGHEAPYSVPSPLEAAKVIGKDRKIVMNL